MSLKEVTLCSRQDLDGWGWGGAWEWIKQGTWLFLNEADEPLLPEWVTHHHHWLKAACHHGRLPSLPWSSWWPVQGSVFALASPSGLWGRC